MANRIMPADKKAKAQIKLFKKISDSKTKMCILLLM